jgi:5-methylcytosine-specific restriction enzyme subunit McrC
VNVRTVSVVESRWTTVTLSAGEQRELEQAGRTLASGTTRFGALDRESAASLIHVQRLDERTARVRAHNAVGLVACSTVQLLVTPKVPTPHFLHLLAEADVVPRLDHAPAWTAESDDLTWLVCHWFVAAAERVVEEGLARDYRPLREQVPVVRGRLDVLATTRLYYRGRPAVVSEFEEYDFDTPLNRTLLHATRVVATGPTLPHELRARALRVSKRFDGVGALRRNDLDVRVERRTSYYADALLLARQIIEATGRTLASGGSRSWTFLIGTAKPVEQAMRKIAQDAIGRAGSVKQGRRRLPRGTLTVNPDLVVRLADQLLVGDVKYKRAGNEWDRDDLYEVVAFATAYRAPRACLISFAVDNTEAVAPVTFGDVTVSDLRWDARPTTTPEGASNALRQQLRDWISDGIQPHDASARDRQP